MAQGDGVSLTSARYLALQAVITSKEGRAVMMQAIADGRPPLCGVDGLLAKIIIDYAARDDQMLRSAGSLVAESMAALGYTKGPMRPCPDCTVASGTMFTPPPSNLGGRPAISAG